MLPPNNPKAQKFNPPFTLQKNENIYPTQTEASIPYQEHSTLWRVSEAGVNGSIGSSLGLLRRWRYSPDDAMPRSFR
jgi:hypothetical protein